MSEKIENLLNLALQATEEERERSEELDVGFDPVENEWELIVKYSGDLERIREIASSVTGLLNGYAVVVIREERIGALAGLDEVEFIEKPKNLFFQVENGRNASCINAVQNPPFSLSGRGVLVGIVDSGIDLTHPDFRNDEDHPGCGTLGPDSGRKTAGGVFQGERVHGSGDRPDAAGGFGSLR